MKKILIFTYLFFSDPVRYPPEKLNQFVNDLHSNGQHYTIIADPSIKILDGYKAFDDGIKYNIFVKDQTGSNCLAKLWAGK